jgi:DUF4097 and DUF4098 domain-containing protein YvlB
LLTGHLNSGAFWGWYGHWWPLLLIGAGLALLGEWAIDLKREIPVRRGGSFVGILILLAILGFGAAGWNNFWGSNHFEWGGPGNAFFNGFGLPEHDNDQQSLNTQIPANASIEIDNPRGDISVTAVDGSTVEVQAHEMAYAISDADAKKIFDAEAPHVMVSGNAVLVKSDRNDCGRLNLTVTVPKTAKVMVNISEGDVTAAGMGGGIIVTANGDVHLNSIAGPVEAHFPKGNHDFSAHDIRGDLSVDGNLHDVTFSEIKGKVAQNGEIEGDVHMEVIHGPLSLHTSVTNLEVAELPGDLSIDSDELRVNEAKGQVRVVTHSKDIDLNQIYGASYAEDRDGEISIEPAGAYAVDAENRKGGIEVTLPPSASAMVTARTHNGDIISDFAIRPSEGENKLATFQIGSGASKIVLSAENGDVRIKKGPAFAPAPAAAPAAGTEAPSALHLKTSKALSARPVTQ